MQTYKETIIHPNWYFGEFWGRFIPEALVPLFDELAQKFFELKDSNDFIQELRFYYKNYIWRPSPLIYAENLSKYLGWAQIYLKNEGVNHTWAHKINHCVWQILLAKKLWKTRIIAETWAWQHWIATSSVCAKLWLECVIYMWEVDYLRQRPNVYIMELAWATVIPVKKWSRTLKDAVNESIRDLLNNSENSYYLLWTACWPHPYPSMNVFFQKIIGEEVREQCIEATWKIPDILIACVGWWSNAQWLFYDFLDDPEVRLIWVEAWGEKMKKWKHAARFAQKKVWIIEWFKSYFLQNSDGQIENTSSIAAWLDYCWVSPQLSYLESEKRVEMYYALDKDVLNSVKKLMQLEWILPALESAHALAYAEKIAPSLPKDTVIVVNISGRWDKDLFITAPMLDNKFLNFLQNFSWNTQ